ncbi:YeeE/YedE family protein [Paraburkholderia bannensis]|uniref:YeeE/YedE family protein n=1 Tax=Paraburkholderia bannensis TaxID=765414 RepID=UPI002AC3213D|nr:YeeE/YedE thiosulfate transporter family protein [Paraburkholderia bannensis]
MTHFTPYSALAGGLLIGLSAALLLWLNGRIAGISGIARQLIWGERRDAAWRAAFLVGLIAGAAACYALARALGHADLAPQARTGFPPALLIFAGLATGYGTALAHGCTSGHGVCGLARFSRRSALATAVFLLTAIVTTFFVRHVLGLQ